MMESPLDIVSLDIEWTSYFTFIIGGRGGFVQTLHKFGSR